VRTAGFAATCVGSPADVVGTRIMTDRSATQKGLLQYVVHMVRDEGVGSLYKGFVPNFARIGRWALDTLGHMNERLLFECFCFR